MNDPKMIAAGLSKAQRAYLRALSEAEYFPRHGVTANWALRHGYADTLVHFSDGTATPWGSLSPDDLPRADFIGGQVLTELGLAVKAALESDHV